MKILAIDTTTNFASIALTDGERVVEEVALDPVGAFDEIIFTEIEKLLMRHHLTLRDIDCYAAASGPGTFTGVRVGLTSVKGLAEAMSRKVVAVSNLKAMAYFGTRELRAPILDARRSEVYAAVYNSALELVQDEVVTNQESWMASLNADVEVLSDPQRWASAVGIIAAREFAAGRAVDPESVDANYVRRSDAEKQWTEAV